MTGGGLLQARLADGLAAGNASDASTGAGAFLAAWAACTGDAAPALEVQLLPPVLTAPGVPQPTPAPPAPWRAVLGAALGTLLVAGAGVALYIAAPPCRSIRRRRRPSFSIGGAAVTAITVAEVHGAGGGGGDLHAVPTRTNHRMWRHGGGGGSGDAGVGAAPVVVGGQQ